MLFSDEQSAIDLLIFNGIPEEDINDGIFIADYDEEFGEES